MADNAESSVPPTGPRAIGSLAKKPSDVTRQGTQKLKFVPTLPARRKKEELKQEAPQPSVQPSDRGNGRGRGRGRGRGGEGRGTAPRPPPVEMTASGPFAMGPALAGTSAQRSAPRSNFTPVVPPGSAKGGANPSKLAVPTSKTEKQRENPLVDTAQTPKNESDTEAYSEPDEGVEIIDMENVRQLDWMAPETLQRERRDRRKLKRMKAEIEELSLSSIPNHPGPSVENVRDALDLSESEEEDLEDLMEDFTIQTNVGEERLYFFQFPEPFPAFASTPGLSREMDIDSPDQGTSTLKRKVSFATDAKPPAATTKSTTPATQVDPEVSKETPRIDGVIGRVEVYRSGAVKMRLGNGIVLNVSEGTQPSFLQQAVHLDMENKKLHVMGEVNKRFVVSPDLDALLTSMELADASSATPLNDANLIKMDCM